VALQRPVVERSESVVRDDAAAAAAAAAAVRVI
jgi:hypothetical protein